MRKRLIPAMLFLVHLACLASDATSVEVRLREGEAQLAAGHFSEAMASCSAGLKELGDSYASPKVEDDTSLKLMAAELQLKEGRIGNAAAISCQMLRLRQEHWQRQREKGTATRSTRAR